MTYVTVSDHQAGDVSFLSDWDMSRHDLAQIELRSLMLRRIFLVQRLGCWPPEHVEHRELERCKTDLGILVL